MADINANVDNDDASNINPINTPMTLEELARIMRNGFAEFTGKKADVKNDVNINATKPPAVTLEMLAQILVGIRDDIAELRNDRVDLESGDSNKEELDPLVSVITDTTLKSNVTDTTTISGDVISIESEIESYSSELSDDSNALSPDNDTNITGLRTGITRVDFFSLL